MRTLGSHSSRSQALVGRDSPFLKGREWWLSPLLQSAERFRQGAPGQARRIPNQPSVLAIGQRRYSECNHARDADDRLSITGAQRSRPGSLLAVDIGRVAVRPKLPGPAHPGLWISEEETTGKAHAGWQNQSVPRMTGYLSPTLTVTNLERSLHWYRDIFDLTIRREYEPPDKSQRDACLLEPGTGLEICLVEYAAGPRQPFNEFAPGLDHLEFLVAERIDLDEWAERLGSLGLPHSGVKESRTRGMPS